jgi:hypothetical protein
MKEALLFIAITQITAAIILTSHKAKIAWRSLSEYGKNEIRKGDFRSRMGMIRYNGNILLLIWLILPVYFNIKHCVPNKVDYQNLVLFSFINGIALTSSIAILYYYN